jgi:hypothetical protein
MMRQTIILSITWRVRRKRRKSIWRELLRGYFSCDEQYFQCLTFHSSASIDGREAGLGPFLLILFICCFCSFSTSVSLAALCSNGRMSTGGSYFLIFQSFRSSFWELPKDSVSGLPQQFLLAFILL